MRYRAIIAAGFIAFAGFVPSAEAQPYRARQGVQSGQVQSLDQILSAIRRQRPGSLADVQGPNPSPEGSPRYRLKWVTPDGRVLWLDTDARTGRVLGVEGEDRGSPVGAAPPPGYGGVPVAPPGYPVPPPGYGRAPPGYAPQPTVVPPPQAFGPQPGYGPPAYPPRGFVPRPVPPGVSRVPPGRGRGYGR